MSIKAAYTALRNQLALDYKNLVFEDDGTAIRPEHFDAADADINNMNITDFFTELVKYEGIRA